MRFDIATLFPDFMENALNESVIGRARKKGLFEAPCHNIRDYTLDKHRRVDDTPYSERQGMLMQAQPIYDCWKAVCGERKPHVIYMSPQGATLTQKKSLELAQMSDIFILCGHYEGVDERILEEIVTDYVSIGDYVLTGGELPAMVMIDAVSRLVPGVLNNEESAEFESFHDNLLEHPQYTRPVEFRGRKVPDVLLSGHHGNIDKWRREQSLKRTLERRPDLIETAILSKEDEKYLKKLKKGLHESE